MTFILYLKTKKDRVWGVRYIGNVFTTVVYIFFGVSSEKNVNTVIIIALHKSRLLPVFPHNKAPGSLSS